MKIYTNKPKLLKTEIFEKALKVTQNDVKDVCVGIKFVSKFKIKRLNKTFRGINKVTDVLSFPMFETTKFSTLQNFESERDPVTNQLEIGDIVICLARAKKQAKQYGHNLSREVNFLALHGFLHLLGFDHIKKSDEKEMFTLAETILSQAGLKRGENV